MIDPCRFFSLAGAGSAEVASSEANVDRRKQLNRRIGLLGLMGHIGPLKKQSYPTHWFHKSHSCLSIELPQFEFLNRCSRRIHIQPQPCQQFFH